MFVTIDFCYLCIYQNTERGMSRRKIKIYARNMARLVKYETVGNPFTLYAVLCVADMTYSFPLSAVVCRLDSFSSGPLCF